MSDRAKTIMVTITMIILVTIVLWGYYEAHHWRQDRDERIELEVQMEMILKDNALSAPSAWK